MGVVRVSENDGSMVSQVRVCASGYGRGSVGWADIGSAGGSGSRKGG